ncbi:hypothetical protein KBZ94_02480 [Streptomyces sp. RM72]|uniref:hypothetical protein n=1 Tax=Streptomyces sp. RM72 TaxID=1115510 RepID=UPI001B38CB26|nr:hypothetical protein [Streptomyces sp. RM72]MBQ0883807.1 hypothetical protein [Streptomyces sp. RM72]
MTEEFVLELDEGMLEYFRAMADVLVYRCGVSRPEAVARINHQYADLKVGPYPDLLCHEPPDFWALPAYYDRGVHALPPTGDPDADAPIDFSRLPIHPPPPRDSRFWTLPR